MQVSWILRRITDELRANIELEEVPPPARRH
jgi:hypothetical protein